MLNFCKESDFSLEIIVYGKLYPSFQTAVLAEILPGVLCVHGVQREFEDLMKVAD